MEKNIIDSLKPSEEQQVQLTQAILASDPNEIFKAVVAMLDKFAEDDKNITDEQRFEFLQLLKKTSPTSKIQLPEKFSQSFIPQMQQIFVNLTNKEALYDIQVDLVTAIKAAQQQKIRQQEDYVRRLKSKQSKATRLQHADEEINDVAGKIPSYRSNNALFDERGLGQMCWELLHKEFIAPLDAENFPKGIKYKKDKENADEESQNKYVELSRKMFNGDKNGYAPAMK